MADADVRWFCNNEQCSNYKVEIAHNDIDVNENPAYNCKACDVQLNTATYVTANDSLSAPSGNIS